MNSQEGTAKKFLYSGPNKSSGSNDQREWNFSYNKKTPTTANTVDLENVWSIKRNVGLNKSNSISEDKLSLNADTKFYSRHNNLNGFSVRKPLSSSLSIDGKPSAEPDPSNSDFSKRRNSNTRRHSITPEDDFDF